MNKQYKWKSLIKKVQNYKPQNSLEQGEIKLIKNRIQQIITTYPNTNTIVNSIQKRESSIKLGN